MKLEVPNQVSQWENAYEEHAERQLQNPFSEWSGEATKKPIHPKYFYPPGGVVGGTIQPKTFYPSREASPQIAPPENYYPSGIPSSNAIHPKYFYPPGGASPTTIQPKSFFPADAGKTIHPKYFYPPGGQSPTTNPPEIHYPTGESSPTPINPKHFHPQRGASPLTIPQENLYSQRGASPLTIPQENFYPSGQPSPATIQPKNFYPSADPSLNTTPPTFYPSAPPSTRFSNPQTPDLPNSNKSDGTVGFLAQVRKWRKPGTEVNELVPLQQIPEPAQPAEPIKVKTEAPWEDPLTGETFTPQDPNWVGRSEESPQGIERPEYLNWGHLPEKEYFKLQENQVIPDEVSEVIPGWTPMGRSFASNVGGEQTLSDEFYQKQRQYDTRVEYNYPEYSYPEYSYPDPVGSWDSPVNVTESYANQQEEGETEDMTYKYQNMSSQISMWQQRVKEHEEKQMINPFSGWEGAACPSQRSTIGLRLGKLGALTKSDPNYGRPVEGSMTDIRGKKAGEHISGEILDLCRNITAFGKHQPDNSVVIKFGSLFKNYTKISNKLVGMLMRARKQNLVNFEGEMLYQGRDDDVVIKLLKAVEQQTTESVAGIESESGDVARSSGGAPADIKIPASGKEASATGASPEEMLSKRDSASKMMERSSSISSSSMMNEESCMSMQEESLGGSKMMAASSNSSQMMSKEAGEFSTKMLAGSSNSSKMMSKEETATSTKMLSESSSSMKMMKEEGSISTQMLGEGDSTKMLAGLSISPAVTQEALMDSLKAGDIFNSMKMVPSDGNTSQLMSKNGLGTISNMAASEMMSSQQTSSSSSMMSKQMSTEQMSMGSEQMTTAMENMSMSSAESKQTKMLSSQMSTASEQMSSTSEQMSMASEQMSMSSKQMSSSSQMKQVSDISSVSSSDMMSSLLDDSFGNMVGTLGTTTSNSIQKSSQQLSSSKVLSKTLSSFESSDTALMDETHSVLSSDLQQLT